MPTPEDSGSVEIWIFIGGLCVTFIGWLYKMLISALRSLEKTDKELADRVTEIEVQIAGSYVTREELDEKMTMISLRLDRILELLSNKVDR